ncbi:GNAT family acetyltransferase [Knoellia subterranea KCTC 19937]|uniref:GNAT family acetyltransferase n=1 Tax=Knoellia subterranea KCTC 19937 TaxID=1385521 RepID=A0A0A0JH58_9MICO|nr:GNAT family acetyltransferase [Knoellia subterranea KCTC 19937]
MGTLGRVDASRLPGWIAERGTELVGLLTYHVGDDTVDLVTINAFDRGGVGSALLRALIDSARDVGATRVRVTTTNDNTRALWFYQQAGFRLSALRVGAVAEARRLKPQIPETGLDGIPLRDEVDLEFLL